MKCISWTHTRYIGHHFFSNLKLKSNFLSQWSINGVGRREIYSHKFIYCHNFVHLYRSLFNENTIRILLQSIKRQMTRSAKGLVLGSVGVYAFDWETERIKLHKLKSYCSEIDFIKKLKHDTIFCSSCKKRKVVSEKNENIEYCSCKNVNNPLVSKDGWEPYLETEHMIIWRKEEKPALYAYKVYASYADINAMDFLYVQTDIEYRKVWDDTAEKLEIIDTDPENKNSHVIYWEMRWPKLFANRDYVYSRRFFKDECTNVIVICSNSTSHAKCPVIAEKQRITQYWSYMVIKPFNDPNKPGLEFVLTYFDDPGLAIPSTITSWVAQKQMPEFITKMYEATKDYIEHKKTKSNRDTNLITFRSLRNNTINDYSGTEQKNDTSHFKTEDLNLEPNGEEIVHETIQKNQSWWSFLYTFNIFG